MGSAMTPTAEAHLLPLVVRASTVVARDGDVPFSDAQSKSHSKLLAEPTARCKSSIPIDLQTQ